MGPCVLNDSLVCFMSQAALPPPWARLHLAALAAAAASVRRPQEQQLEHTLAAAAVCWEQWQAELEGTLHRQQAHSLDGMLSCLGSMVLTLLLVVCLLLDMMAWARVVLLAARYGCCRF